jgi:hypothetical protein
LPNWCFLTKKSKMTTWFGKLQKMLSAWHRRFSQWKSGGRVKKELKNGEGFWIQIYKIYLAYLFRSWQNIRFDK